jgi:FMN phosphatase YigB (HAD superfamily)
MRPDGCRGLAVMFGIPLYAVTLPTPLPHVQSGQAPRRHPTPAPCQPNFLRPCRDLGLRPRQHALPAGNAAVPADQPPDDRLRHARDRRRPGRGRPPAPPLLEGTWHDAGRADASPRRRSRPFPRGGSRDRLHRAEPRPGAGPRIAALPGRRIVYTNGTEPYARRVLEHRALSGICSMRSTAWNMPATRPSRGRGLRDGVRADGLDPTRAAMFEDDPRNLAAPHAMGMRTVHVAPEPEPADHIHHHTDDLSGLSRPPARLSGMDRVPRRRPPCPRPILPPMSEIEDIDVFVSGGGVAGLTASHRLRPGGVPHGLRRSRAADHRA